MKCMILVSEKMSGLPIAECSGAVLTEDKQLVVSEKVGAEILKHYGSRVVVAGSIEVDRLAQGHYELKKAGVKPFAVDPKGRMPSIDAPAVAPLAQDRSMIGKRTKKKAE